MAKFVAIFAVFDATAFAFPRHGARNRRLNRCFLIASAAGPSSMVKKKFEAGFNAN
ncbi:hypothetical protein [Bradyrhizobium sp. HKCCYLRH3061]|uniref:hypothetical protein n=1 Tax=Bradyrhizobium TaxID=374 RepID=UPI003EBA7183